MASRPKQPTQKSVSTLSRSLKRSDMKVSETK